MKTKQFLFAACAALCMMVLNSCNAGETIIQASVKAANMQCPMEMGAGMTMTAVEYGGNYVTYSIKGDETMYSYSQDMVTDAMKEQLVSALKSSATLDKNAEKFLKALRENNVGIIYHYYTPSSTMDVVLESTDF